MLGSGQLGHDDNKVWRYMTFGRFVWMLVRKRLWLSRCDLLSDRWEGRVSASTLAAMLADGRVYEPDQLAGIIEIERTRNFVSCWTLAEHESDALWRIYCGVSEGVAIQTTLGRLRDSVAACRVDFGEPEPELDLKPVVYDDGHLPAPYVGELIMRKRQMFAYEREVRVVFFRQDSKPQPMGRELRWDPENVLEHVWVHPFADEPFKDTVDAVVAAFAPTLSGRVSMSKMTSEPAA
jgi:hypothetical protein